MTQPQVLPEQISEIEASLLLKTVASAFNFSPLARLLLISLMISGVNFVQLRRRLSAAGSQRRFLAALFCLFSSMWSTCQQSALLPIGPGHGGKKLCATKE